MMNSPSSFIFSSQLCFKTSYFYVGLCDRSENTKLNTKVEKIKSLFLWSFQFGKERDEKIVIIINEFQLCLMLQR